MFLKSPVPRSPFYEVAQWSPAALLKRNSNTGVACEFCEIFKNKFFLIKRLRATACDIPDEKFDPEKIVLMAPWSFRFCEFPNGINERSVFLK